MQRDSQGRVLHRYEVYRSQESPRWLCICAARDKAHALKIARQQHNLSRTAYAQREDGQTEALPFVSTSGYAPQNGGGW